MLKKFTDDFGFMTVEDSAKLDSISDGYISQDDSRLSNDRVASGIRTATTVVSVSSAAAPTSGQVMTATGSASAQWQTPIPSIAAGEVFYLDGYTLPDGYRLTPFSQYSPSTEIVLTAGMSPGQTVNICTFVSEVPIGEPFVQQGEWAFDTFASVNNNDGYVTIEIDGYSRSITNVDTYLFTTTTSIINTNISALYSSNTFNGMFQVTPTDRLVIKYRATKTGGSGTTTVALYIQDNTHASHVHTPIGVAQYAVVAPLVIKNFPDNTISLPAASSIQDGYMLKADKAKLDGIYDGYVSKNDSRLSDDRVASGIRTATTVVSVSSAVAPTAGQVMTATSGTAAQWGGDINVGGSITNFDNGHTTVDVALTSDPSASVLAVTLLGLTASHKYLATLGGRVYIYTDADHSVGGAVDMVIGLSIVTDGSSVATCTLSGTVIPDVSNLPTGISGATATIAASAGGFTISATRQPSTNCHARAKWWVNKFEDVT